MQRGKKPKIGDIYEVKVPSGFAYVQYTHDGQEMGQLVRVLPNIYSVRVTDFAKVAKQRELYFIFLILAHSLPKTEFELVSNQPIPESARPFPTMRKTGGRAKGGRVLSWYIGHGLRLYTVLEMQRALHVRELTPEQARLSIAQIWAASTLAEKIEQGWLPERAEEFEEAARKKTEVHQAEPYGTRSDGARFIDHYLYFPRRHDAERAADRVRAMTWAVEFKMGADGKNWLVLAKQPVPIEEDIGDIRDELERLAEEFHGEYDGWGASV